MDEFLKNFANNRTDEYGGTPENKGRFYIEVIDAVVEAIGADRTALKISPWATAPGYGTSSVSLVDLYADDPPRRWCRA